VLTDHRAPHASHPVTTLTQLADSMQTLLTTVADELAERCGFVRRRRRLTGSRFAQALVFAWLEDPHATEARLAHAAAVAGADVTPQALVKRFTPAAAEFLRLLLAEATARVVHAAAPAAPLLDRFTELVVLDSSTVALPDALAGTWRGCGGSTEHGTAAAVKLTVGLDLKSGALRGPEPAHGRDADLAAGPAVEGPAPGGLQVADLGYFSLAAFAAWGRRGGYWLSRLKTKTAAFDASGRRLDLAATLGAAGEAAVDLEVTLGSEARLPCRLIARRVPPGVAATRRARLVHKSERRGDRPSALALELCDWTILVTNAPAALLSASEAMAAYRLRWQIELVFKLWKGQGGLATWRGSKPARVLCEVYAKLLAAVVKHWLTVVGAWSRPDRSPTKAGRVIAALAPTLAGAVGGPRRLRRAIALVRSRLAMHCRMTRRRKKPNAYQLLFCP
jgi:hypothetical protein